jgi:uncharacterized membrane-anchored protein
MGARDVHRRMGIVPLPPPSVRCGMLERGERSMVRVACAALAIVSVVALVLLVWRELTVDEPIIDLRILKSRQLAPGSRLRRS